MPEPLHVLTVTDALAWLREQGISDGNDPRATTLMLALQAARLGDEPVSIQRYRQLVGATAAQHRPRLFAQWAQGGDAA